VTQPSTENRSRAWVEVDLDALVANARHVRSTAGPAVTLLPMIKADAYGLGMLPVARALAASFPRDQLAGFGVATVSEGETLRAAGWAGRILVLAPVAPGEYSRAAAADLVLSASDTAAVREWAAAARSSGRRLSMQVEIDTGIGRSGFAAESAAEWGPEILRLSGDAVRWEGTFTHFHSADEPDLLPTRQQWERFTEALAQLPRGAPRTLVHAANSAAALRCHFPCAWLRSGIFLYGGRVGAEPPMPVVAVRARLALVREVAAGATLGYGATYTAARAERWGTLAIGYGDGLPRALGPAGGAALLREQRVPIIGRISMDMTVVDLTGVPDAAVGDIATLIGRRGDLEISLDEVADRVDTISYEILTGLTTRLPRLYRGAAVEAALGSGFPAPDRG
jgi:alanine racemase